MHIDDTHLALRLLVPSTATSPAAIAESRCGASRPTAQRSRPGLGPRYASRARVTTLRNGLHRPHTHQNTNPLVTRRPVTCTAPSGPG